MTLVLPTRDGYDRWAEIYDGEWNPLVEMEEPHVHRLLGDVRGLHALDVGCGTGRHALHMHAAGAKVTALDFSAGMLAKARAKPGAEGVAWIEHDLAGRLPVEDRAFDRVVCALVVDHIADLARFFVELGRATRADGRLVVSTMHPAMMLKGVQARFRDPATGEEVRPQSVANQISDYVMAALAADLTIEHLSEHAVDEELARRVPRAEKYVGWPMLLVMTLRPRPA